MKTKREHFIYNQSGNAMIYVLIAIVLFAALSFALSRQTDTSEANDVSDAHAEMYSTQLISYATAAKSAIDQMVFTGTSIDNLDFTAPTDAAFNNPPTTTKVYHPDGGGLNPGVLPPEAADTTISSPAAGWYLGRFNNVGWTKTSATDVILIAYGIKQKICQQINKRATGSTAIPKLSARITSVLIAGTVWGGTNNDFITDPAGSPVCAACDHKPSMCVEDSNGGIYGFYTVVQDR